ncbi:MAG: PH domain-containing protein [Acidimicrobiia bacterium]|nr:PH domain-containing protein [Acidimicrobiia bacterium]
MKEVFLNSRIDVQDLPELPPDSFEPLAPAFLRSKYVADAITAMIVVVLAVFATAVMRAAKGPVWVPLAAAAVVLALIGLAAVLQTMSVRHLGYLVRDHDLTLRQGVIVRITSTIPYNRVQHVGVDRGPIERLYGLATLQLRSAGGVIGISGLTTSDANRLKELVARRAGMDDVGRTDASVAPQTPPDASDGPDTDRTPDVDPPPPGATEQPWAPPGE